MTDRSSTPGVVRSRPLAVGSLCTGYGGLDLAVHNVFGGELAWCSEVEPAPVDLLAERFAGVPNLGDLMALRWEDVPAVDILTAGYPCQPFSHAGSRKGTNDDRHLWPHIADALRVLRPRVAVFENVAGHLSLGFDAVIADLAALGFHAEWSVVRASDVGACHSRARLFIVATDADHQGPRVGRTESDRSAELGGRVTDAPHAQGYARRLSDGDGCTLAHAYGSGGEARDGRPGSGDAGRLQPLDRGETDWGDYRPAILRHAAVVGRPAPRPTDDRGRLDPPFVEWMQMLPDGWVTDLITNRPRALKALGNGVVPPQAAHACRGLLARASERVAVAA